MTYMPKFVHPALDDTSNQQINPEAQLLKNLAEKNLAQLLHNRNLSATPDVYKQRLNAELKIINEKAYTSYFLIVADYVQWAKDNGIAVGPGRGSGPCSLVGFVLGITNIDPLEYMLPFERFVNPNKESLPDFDIDFCDKRRHEVTSYIQSKYGADKVAQISSDDIRPLPSRLIICDRPLDKLVALYPNPESGFPTAEISLRHVANAGLVQFNAINQKALTIIQNTVDILAKLGIAIDINNIPLNDAAAYHILSAGERSNIAIQDNEHYKNTLISVQPQHFNELCAVIALCQPRALSQIEEYITRKNRPDSVQYAHSAIENITADTYGLILYQEQVMHIAHNVASFTYADADTFRRILKQCNEPDVQVQHIRFLKGALSMGLSQPEANSLFQLVVESNERSFTKAHAVSYATIAYQIAWLSANYPNEYAQSKQAL